MDKKDYKRKAVESIQDYDLLKKHHHFLRESSDDEEEDGPRNKGERLAKKYYDKLYKDYVLVNL